MTTKVHQYEARIAAIHTLRVNMKSLAAESRFIRKEERRAGECYRLMLREHRIKKLRQECRYTHLALAFVRNKPYLAVENKLTNAFPVDPKRLTKKIKGHLKQTSFEAVRIWLSGQ